MQTNKPHSLVKAGFWQESLVPFLSLFTSLGTLVCCALPALLVTLGLGAALAGVVSAAPWLVALSAHKGLVFTVSGVMILTSATLQWRGRYKSCPIDPVKGKACLKLRRLSWWILGFAALVYLIGAFFAFFAASIFYG